MSVKRAHMITRGYLEAWTNDRGLLHVWDAENRINGVQSLNNATVVSYAYRTEVTSFNIEADYSRIESGSLPALRNLATGGGPNRDGRAAIIQFLDMHLERGRYADQAKVTVPVALGSINAPVKIMDMGLGDRLTFSRDIDTDVVRLSTLDLERWRWRVYEVESGLVTGDGAVLMFQQTTGAPVNAVTFPLSFDKLLVIGDGIDGLALHINQLISSKCRRWLVDRVDGDIARTVGA